MTFHINDISQKSKREILEVWDEAVKHMGLQDKRIAELERQFKPTLFWDASDTEVSHDSIEELMHLKFEDGAKVGDKVDIQRATLLPNQTYIITKTDDDDYSCEYELKEHKDDD
jgi:hypothetical protein